MTLPTGERPAPSTESGAAETRPLLERLAEDMGRRWAAGERPLTEEYLARHPELAGQPEAALELLAEEIYLRAEAGAEPADAEFLARFPAWPRQVQALLDCHRLLSAHAAPHFPEAGETLGDFRLLAELGRGAHGRVFLAAQPELADRPVVLKLAPAAGHEHLSLSRLQHTHIVPLHSVHDFPEQGLRGLCQPYFGGVTLAELLRQLDAVAPVERTGRRIVDVLDQAVASAAAAVPARGPGRQFLARASYAQAVCWLGACLAEALQYAHERGLLHLDIKPSNVLLAADGQPMLLDFHLAHPPLTAGVPAPSGLGGTPGAMAPEHRAALAAVAARDTLAASVDGRADVFSLGVLLYGALGGAVPPPEERPAAALRRRNPRITHALADLLARCLAPDPADRYASAGELAADLRRHLADRPLHGVANRSLTERWQKFRRRRPFALPLGSLLVVTVLAAGLAAEHFTRQARMAESAAGDGEELLRQERFAEARDAFRLGLALTADVPLAGELGRRLHDGTARAERGELAGALHGLCERLRPLYGADAPAGATARQAVESCAALWARRDDIARQLGGSAGPRVRADLLDLAVLWADLRVRLAVSADLPAARREALDVLDQAETLFGPSCVLSLEREQQARALGRTALADTAAVQVAAHPPRTAWEHYALGRAHLRAGDLTRAAEQLDRAVEEEPQDPWANFARGVCAARAGAHADALAAFSAALATAPLSAPCAYNRGRAYAALGRLDRARQDYDRALRLDPSLAAAYVGRADVARQQGRFDEALADLTRARQAGSAAATVSYHEALVYAARGDTAAALRRLREALRADPAHTEARDLLGRLQPGS